MFRGFYLIVFVSCVCRLVALKCHLSLLNNCMSMDYNLYQRTLCLTPLKCSFYKNRISNLSDFGYLITTTPMLEP